MDRDLEVHRLTARLRALRRFGLDLCLGHMVGADDPEPVYVGRLGLTDSTGRRLLIDWRSPAAEPFFGATHANPMGLASRRRYRWTRGRISDYWDEVFTAGRASTGTPPPSTTSPPSSPAWAAAGRPGCATCSAPSRPTRTRSSARGPAARSSSTAGRARARRWSPCTAPPTSSTPTRASVTAAAACCSSVRTSPTWPTSPTSSPASARRACRPARCATSSPRAPTAAVETDPDVARLKSSADMVTAIEPAVRFYEEPPTEGMTVETHWSDVWLSADDWAEAFAAPDPGTPHNEARDQVWEELLTILVDKHERRGRPGRPAAPVAARRTRSWSRTFNRAWPLLEATDLVGDLWSVPAYLRLCAPWLDPDEVRTLQRADAAGLDGVRPAAPGRGPAAARRPGGVPAPASAARPPSPPNASGWPRSSTT